MTAETANNYVIGNPLEPTLDSYGFIDNLRDEGRVTDGVIKGPICDCQAAETQYTDTSLLAETFKTFPDYQIPDLDLKGECIQ